MEGTPQTHEPLSQGETEEQKQEVFAMAEPGARNFSINLLFRRAQPLPPNIL